MGEQYSLLTAISNAPKSTHSSKRLKSGSSVASIHLKVATERAALLKGKYALEMQKAQLQTTVVWNKWNWK